MRIAIISDIHGNRTAFGAVLADLRQMSPDLVLHCGDLADAGASPVYIVDRIRDLGWQGVLGNTDEMLFRPESLEEFANQSAAPPALWAAIREMAVVNRTMLGEERLAWLSALPRIQSHGPITLVHASPETTWRAPGPAATDAELESVFRSLGQSVVVYGHIHHPYVRNLSGLTVANPGSVGLPYDGDRRASYVLLDDAKPTIRRVEYEVSKELKALASSGFPHADWTAKMLAAARPQMP